MRSDPVRHPTSAKLPRAKGSVESFRAGQSWGACEITWRRTGIPHMRIDEDISSLDRDSICKLVRSTNTELLSSCLDSNNRLR